MSESKPIDPSGRYALMSDLKAAEAERDNWKASCARYLRDRMDAEAEVERVDGVVERLQSERDRLREVVRESLLRPNPLAARVAELEAALDPLAICQLDGVMKGDPNCCAGCRARAALAGPAQTEEQA